MKIGIQEEGKEKQIFFTFKDASEATGISSTVIWKFIKNKNKGHDKFVRKSDQNVFIIQEENEIPFIQIDGENFFSIQEILEKFGISRTLLPDQSTPEEKKNHFLDCEEISHHVTGISLAFEEFIDLLRQHQMQEKIYQKIKGKKRSANFKKYDAIIGDEEMINIAKNV